MASLESSIRELCVSIDKAADQVLPEQLKKIVNGRALVGGLVFVLPCFGLEVIIYVIALWGMYYKISQTAGVPFGGIKAVLSAVIVNIVIGIVANVALDALIGLGQIILFAVGYFSIKASAILYLESLTRMYSGKNLKIKNNYSNLSDASAAITENMVSLGKESIKSLAEEAGVTEIVDAVTESNLLTDSAPVQDATSISEKEQQYVDEVRALLADGEITDKERRLLERLRQALEISEERAKEIESNA